MVRLYLLKNYNRVNDMDTGLGNFEFIAHVRESDGAEQPLYDHLTGTAEISKRLASKIGLPLSGELIGLVHDLGKYSEAFQTYTRAYVKFDNYKN